jgi:hypothetical protein
MSEPTIPEPLLRRLTQRPPVGPKPVAKTISKVSPEVIVPAAADPAVLIRLTSDLRLSLGQLAAETKTTLRSSYVVTRLATGYLDLAPLGDDCPPEDQPPGFLHCRVDGRRRLALNPGLLHRLAARVGDKVLVTLTPDTEELRVMNLATVADAFEALHARHHTADPERVEDRGEGSR